MSETDYGRVGAAETGSREPRPQAVDGPSGFDPSRGDIWPLGEGVVLTSTGLAKNRGVLVVAAVPDGFGDESGKGARAAWNEAARIKGPAVMLTFASAASAERLGRDLLDLAIAMETREGGDVKQAPSRSDDSAAIAQNPPSDPSERNA